MKKSRLIAGLLTVCLLIGTVPVMATESVTARISPQKIYVDGQRVDLLAYSIDDYNRVRIRDLGKAINCSVFYDASTDSVRIDRKYSYVDGDSEVLPTPGDNPLAAPSEQTVYVSGNLVNIEMHNIADNNYAKLRDLGGTLNLGMAYDPDADAVYIDTQTAYLLNMPPELLRPEAIPVNDTAEQSVSEEITVVENPYFILTGETLIQVAEIELIIKALPEEYNAVKPFVDGLSAMTNREKVNAIVRYVRERMTYGEAGEGTYIRIGKNSAGHETRSMRYAMFLDPPPVKGWCFHYTKGVDFLTILSCVPTVMIESVKSDHAWNAVFVDGEWYYVDATNATAKLNLYPDADVLIEMDAPNLPFSDDNPSATKERMELLVPGSTK